MNDAAASAPAPVQAPSPSTIYAVELLAELIRRGVQDAVVCPGSRSQALALAAAAAERAGALRLHVRVDERSAAFFALGLARETGLPAPIIVTSGTAVANLVPAALEAHEGRVPFIALTADRPAELRGRRTSQTTHQAGLFGAAARLAVDVEVSAAVEHADAPDAAARLAPRALSAALGGGGAASAGPVQLNLAFREPLSGTGGLDAMIEAGFVQAAEEGAAARHNRARQSSDAPLRLRETARSYTTALGWSESETYTLSDPARTVVIAGEGAGMPAAAFARTAGLPLLAEVVSGARQSAETITAYAALLGRAELGLRVERAIVFGHPTLTRQVPALLSRADVETIVVDPHIGDHFNPGGRARVVRTARIADGFDLQPGRAWLDEWLQADATLAADRSADPAPNTRAPLTRELIAARVWQASLPADRLVIAASRMVRVLDGLAQARPVSVRANRGLAGIDGTVATAHGVAAACAAGPNQGVTRLLIGDLALLHDAGSLLLPEGELRPRLQVIVVNDGGGTIFDTLEAAGTSQPADFDRVMLTPQRVDLQALAAAYGWRYQRVESPNELESVLERPAAGPMLVEVTVAR